MAKELVAIKRIAPITTVKEATKSVDQLLANLEKKWGKGIAGRVDKRVGQKIEHIPTGVPQIDLEVIQAGGVPRGMIVELFGPEGGGKSTLALQIIAEATKKGGLAGFIDAEHALSPTRASALGVDMKKLIVSQPDYGEQALEIAEDMVNSAAFHVVVIDSAAALVPRAELEGQMGDSHVGLQARLMSQALRKLTASVAKSKTTLIFINQIREKVGVMFGSPETTPGGRALKFYSSVRIDIRHISQIKDGDEIVGRRTKVKCVKNRVGSPFQEAEIDLIFKIGFDKVGSLFDMAKERNIITTEKGSWLSYEGELYNGRGQMIDVLRGNVTLQDKIRAGVSEHVRQEHEGNAKELEIKAVAEDVTATAGDIDDSFGE